MIKPVSEKSYELYINNNDMSGDKPNFTTYNGMPLAQGTIAINIDTKKGYFWDEEAQDWK